MKRTIQPIFSLVTLAMAAAPAWGFSIHSPQGSDACHEDITGEALREVRKTVPEAGPIAPDRNERAMINDAPFTVPDDLAEVGGITLMLAVRDNDLNGRKPTDNFELVKHHGDPAKQQAHCLRAPDQDGPAGALAALESCKQFIREHFTAALDGLGADGRVDPTRRMTARVVLSLRGGIDAEVPIAHWELGLALHALQDGFTHSLRETSTMRVTEVLNWVEFVEGDLEPARDGPEHLGPLDQCNGPRPEQQARRAAAVAASTDVMKILFTPGRDRAARLAELDSVLARYFAHKDGCTADNEWCSATEFDVPDSSGCRAAPARTRSPLHALGLLGVALVILTWRRRRVLTAVVAAALIVGLAGGAARAESPDAPDDPTTAGDDAPPAPGEPEVIPANPDREAAAEGREPGRDVETPAPAEIVKVRKDKRLGSKWGLYAAGAGSFDNPGFATVLGVRYRVKEKYSLGLDAEWNPWIGTSPVRTHAGSGSLYFTAIRRYPMTWDRVNLRTTAHLGASMLLFDMYGAEKYDVGPFVGLSLLGIDIDLGGSKRLVIDPADLVVPIPHVTGFPLYYPQYRFTIGIQFGG